MKIFISYAHVDEYLVETQIVKILQVAGHEPWFDFELIPGQLWQDQLAEAIDSCDAFVYALTPESVASKFCRWEFEYAVEKAKQIVPVLVQKCNLPDDISQLQYVDFTGGAKGDNVAKLMRGLRVIELDQIERQVQIPTDMPAQADSIDMDAVQEQIDTIEQDLNDERSRRQRTTDENQVLQQQLSTLQNRLNQMLDPKAVQSQISALEQRLHNEQSQYEQSSAENRELRQQLKTLQKQLSEYQKAQALPPKDKPPQQSTSPPKLDTPTYTPKSSGWQSPQFVLPSEKDKPSQQSTSSPMPLDELWSSLSDKKIDEHDEATQPSLPVSMPPPLSQPTNPSSESSDKPKDDTDIFGNAMVSNPLGLGRLPLNRQFLPNDWTREGWNQPLKKEEPAKETSDSSQQKLPTQLQPQAVSASQTLAQLISSVKSSGVLEGRQLQASVKPPPDVHRLSGRNPLDWLRLLYWVLFKPVQIANHREAYGEGTEKSTGTWLVMTMVSIPMLLLMLPIVFNIESATAFALEINVAPQIVLLAILVFWAAIGLHGHTKNYLYAVIAFFAGFIVTSIMMGVAAFSVGFNAIGVIAGFLVISVMNGLAGYNDTQEKINKGIAKEDTILVILYIVVTMAVGVAFGLAELATIDGVVLFFATVIVIWFLVFVFGVGIGVGVGSLVIESIANKKKAFSGHYFIVLVLIVSYTVLIGSSLLSLIAS